MKYKPGSLEEAAQQILLQESVLLIENITPKTGYEKRAISFLIENNINECKKSDYETFLKMSLDEGFKDALKKLIMVGAFTAAALGPTAAKAANVASDTGAPKNKAQLVQVAKNQANDIVKGGGKHIGPGGVDSLLQDVTAKVGILQSKDDVAKAINQSEDSALKLAGILKQQDKDEDSDMGYEKALEKSGFELTMGSNDQINKMGKNTIDISKQSSESTLINGLKNIHQNAIQIGVW